MHILFLGYSNLVKNRILPILDQLHEITKVSIAKFELQSWNNEIFNTDKEIQLFDNYENAIKQSNADLVYISTVNSSHYELAFKCLSLNFHVIIDKPATLNLSQTQKLIKKAQIKNRLLAESLVYLYHPQFSIIKEIIDREQLIPKLLTLAFSFPPLNLDNFRYKKSLGGGALQDTGCYAVSPARFFFNELPQKTFTSLNGLYNNVETSYSVLLKYSQGRAMVGHFGFTTEYINRMNILGDNFSIDIDRVFTIPDNTENRIVFKKNNVVKEIFAPQANTFVLFLKTMINNIYRSNLKDLREQMLFDATAFETIRKTINL